MSGSAAVTPERGLSWRRICVDVSTAKESFAPKKKKRSCFCAAALLRSAAFKVWNLQQQWNRQNKSNCHKGLCKSLGQSLGSMPEFQADGSVCPRGGPCQPEALTELGAPTAQRDREGRRSVAGISTASRGEVAATLTSPSLFI